jgi:hypothetical protein
MSTVREPERVGGDEHDAAEVPRSPGGYDLIVDFLSDGPVFPSRSGPLRCPEVRAVQ